MWKLCIFRKSFSTGGAFVSRLTLSKPVYIEFLGASGVGKSTVMELVLSLFAGVKMTKRAGIQRKFPSNLWDCMRHRHRRKAFFELLGYLRRERGVPLGAGARRAAFITGVPAHRAHARNDKYGVLYSDGGPVGYALAVGASGPQWAHFERILLPEVPESIPFYIYLQASDSTVHARRKHRERPAKKRKGLTGKEGMDAHKRHEGRIYWLTRLQAAGAHTLIVVTDNRAPEEVAQEVVKFVQRVLIY